MTSTSNFLRVLLDCTTGGNSCWSPTRMPQKLHNLESRSWQYCHQVQAQHFMALWVLKSTRLSFCRRVDTSWLYTQTLKSQTTLRGLGNKLENLNGVKHETRCYLCCVCLCGPECCYRKRMPARMFGSLSPSLESLPVGLYGNCAPDNS